MDNFLLCISQEVDTLFRGRHSCLHYIEKVPSYYRLSYSSVGNTGQARAVVFQVYASDIPRTFVHSTVYNNSCSILCLSGIGPIELNENFFQCSMQIMQSLCLAQESSVSYGSLKTYHIVKSVCVCRRSASVLYHNSTPTGAWKQDLEVTPASTTKVSLWCMKASSENTLS